MTANDAGLRYSLVALLVLCACRSGEYRRGTTDYKSGRLGVQQPSHDTQPERSVEGIRVAGPDTDIIPDYWDALLRKSEAERSDPILVFDTFRARHRDLEVYQSGAAEAALREFRRWARTRGIEIAFLDYWTE